MSSTTTASVSRSRPPAGPALVVLGIGLIIVLLGAVIALLGTASAHAPVSSLGTSVPGIAFRAVPAAPYLSKITSAGEPPLDIVKALSVPAASHLVSTATDDASVDQFDRSITVTAADTAAAVAKFYGEELRAGGWSIQFNGKVSSNLELIGQRDGSDGYQWRVALVIAPVNPRLSPALAGSSETSTSRIVMTVYQVVDAS